VPVLLRLELGAAPQAHVAVPQPRVDDGGRVVEIDRLWPGGRVLRPQPLHVEVVEHAQVVHESVLPVQADEPHLGGREDEAAAVVGGGAEVGE